MSWEEGSRAVLDEVFAERQRQVARYGQNDDLEDGTGPEVCWMPLADANYQDAEEIELELRRDYNAWQDLCSKPTWMHLVREEVAEAFKESDPTRLEEELVQVAALCVSWIEKLRSRKSSAED